MEGVRECVSADEAAIRAILDNQITAWNAGDAALHGRHLADDVIFTNIRGQSFGGAEAFIRQHDAIFATSMRLLQVPARRGTAWKIVAYHNVDVKPGVEVPEPGAK